MSEIERQQVARRTKIVATLGPASDSLEVLRSMVRSGMNVARLNFSHGTHAEQQKRIEMIRQVAKEEKVVIGIIADLQGPKIRVANFKQQKIQLDVGQSFILDAALDDDAGDQRQVGIDYKQLPQDVAAGDILLLDDGRVKLRVTAVKGTAIHSEVIVGGPLSNHKGINRQGGGLSARALTDKDKEDMRFALQAKVDFLAISFPRDAADMLEARELMQAYDGSAALISKIERVEAVDNLHEIIEASDAVMVARGDLAVEIGDAEVPRVQKDIINMARACNIPVITATQMMESMIESTVPTRAEVSDVANAVFDHTDAVMLSAESAVGAHPDLVIETMARTCLAAEKAPESGISKHRVECQFERVDESIAMAAVYIANHLQVAAMCSLTESGQTALWMSRLKTNIPIFALSPHALTLGKMTVCRGIYPIYFLASEHKQNEINAHAIDKMLKHFELPIGQRVILTKGDYLGVGGSNALKIVKVGSVV